MLYLPDTGSHPIQRLPVLIYLRGGSLRGDDIEKLRTLGLPNCLEHDRSFPFIVFVHGAQDQLAPIAESESVVHAIQQAKGDIRYTRLEDRDHSILDLYNEPEWSQWLLQHHR